MLIDWFTVAAQVINFLILVWLLKRFLYRPILAAIDEREKRIATELQDAANKKAEAAKEQAAFQLKNKELDGQRSALLLEATNGAKAEREKLLEIARKDSEELRAKLQKTVQGEFEHLNQKIGMLAQQEVFSIARKTLGDLAGANLEEQITRIFIERLRGLSDKEKEEIKASLQGSGKQALVRSALELAPAQRTAIQEAVQSLLGEGTGIEFETKPDLIGGIELAANGKKIAWSIADYLASLTSSMRALVGPKPEAVTVPKEAVPHAA